MEKDVERDVPTSFQEEILDAETFFEPDVEDDVPDIMSPITKKYGSKKVAANVPLAPLDNIPFHS
jgi:hypothetical protein